MSHQLQTLENCLRSWEDYWFIYNIGNVALRESGQKPFMKSTHAAKNYRRFRDFLLTLKKSEDLLALSQFGLPEFDDDQFRKIPKWYSSFPTSIARWCCHSRRVFSLNKDLVHLLQLTNLGGVTWGQVNFPFWSFAMTLDTPVVDAKGIAYDFLIFSIQENQKGKTANGILFPEKCKRLSLLTKSRRRDMSSLLRNKRWAEAYSQFTKSIGSWSSPGFHTFSFDVGDSSDGGETSIEDGFFEAKEFAKVQYPENVDAFDFDEKILRLVIGLCLYKKSVAAKNPSPISGWNPQLRSGKKDSLAITKGAEICTVASIYKLTDDEREVVDSGKSSSEMSCHFREGHWRRPPGLGSDPTAEKTVWVRPALVRRDRLPESGLPGGSQQEL